VLLLSPDQRAAVEHPGGPLLVLGGAGTGKTTVLEERFVHLAGDAPDSLLVLCLDGPAADAMRERLEDRLAGAYEELAVTTLERFCARLLRDEALEAGLDPFATPVSAGDRLAMLLERMDELPLRHHDLRGNPSAALGAIVGRIDRLKDELVTAEDYAAWADTLPEEELREREFARLYGEHERLLAETGSLDAGDLVLHAFRLLRARPQVREGPAPAAARRPQRRHHGDSRRRPVDPPLPRRRHQERAGLPCRMAGCDRCAARALVPRRRAHPARRSRGRGAGAGAAGEGARR
jgi:DNA helicase-2/ATP-dependent DNA helicase PcrA